jgi:hypothetical protein
MPTFNQYMADMVGGLTQHMGRSVILHKPTPLAAADFATGTRYFVSSSLTVKAIHLQVVTDPLMQGGGRQATAVYRVQIAVADVASLGAPSRGWRLDIAGDGSAATSTMITEVERNADGTGYLITATEDV